MLFERQMMYLHFVFGGGRALCTAERLNFLPSTVAHLTTRTSELSADQSSNVSKFVF